MTSTVSLMKTGLCGALALLALVGTADAQEPYPTRPIRLVVGFGAGGPTDIPARFIADKLGDALGQRVIVENKPAASGMIATRDVLSQPRDGYTLLLCTHFEAINTAAYKNVQFKLSDLAPISLIAKYYYGLALANVDSGRHPRDLRAIRQGASRRGDATPPSASARRRRSWRGSWKSSPASR